MPFLPYLIGGLLAGGAAGAILGFKTSKIVSVVIIGGVVYYIFKESQK